MKKNFEDFKLNYLYEVIICKESDPDYNVITECTVVPENTKEELEFFNIINKTKNEDRFPKWTIHHDWDGSRTFDITELGHKDEMPEYYL